MNEYLLRSVFIFSVALVICCVSVSIAWGMSNNADRGSHLIRVEKTYGYTR